MSATSTTHIANLALGRLGESRITALDTDTDTRAVVMREAYTPALHSLLRLHPWNFAGDRAELAALATAPAFGWASAWQLPADFLRMREIWSGESQYTPYGEYTIERRTLLNNLSSTSDDCQITYTSKEVPVAEFDPLFLEALVTLLCARTAGAITQKPAAEAAYTKLHALALANATTIDARETKSGENEGPHASVYRSGLVRSRFNGPTSPLPKAPSA